MSYKQKKHKKLCSIGSIDPVQANNASIFQANVVHPSCRDDKKPRPKKKKSRRCNY